MTEATLTDANRAVFAPERTVLIVADDPSAAADAVKAAESAKLAVAEVVSTGALPSALQRHPTIDVIFVELTAIDDAADLALDILEHGKRAAVIAFPIGCIDAVSSRVTGAHVALLCNPTSAERAVAISAARIGVAFAMKDEKIGEETDRLQKLADEVARIAATLADLAGSPLTSGGDAFSDGMIGYRAGPAVPRGDVAAVSAGDVRGIIRTRRLREQFFPPDLFGEAAWDMLLDLTAARIERKRVAVSSLCIAAAVPPTTALRAIRGMTERGLFVRVDDEMDKRRVFIELGADTADAMLSYLSAAKAQGAMIA